MKKKVPLQSRSRPWTEWTALVLITAFAGWLVLQSLDGTAPDKNSYSLWHLAHRIPRLAAAPDLIARDDLCIPTSAIMREVAQKLPTSARVFGTGLIGPDAGIRLGNYFIAQYHLFPRPVQISTDGPAIYHDGWMEGVDMTSVEQLKALGLDLLLGFGQWDQDDIGFLDLTAKGRFEFRE